MKQQESAISDRLVKMFKDSILSIDYSGNILVLKTLTGSANAACAALDAFEIKEIIGTIAGDDTIFILTRENENMQELAEKFKKLMK